MKIYIAHSRNFEFQKELYESIRKSSLNKEHIFVLPYEKTDKPFDSKEYLKNECELLIAEVSNPSIGLGIELGWADVYDVPIACIYKTGSKFSRSLNIISKNFAEYSNNNELISVIEKIINQMS